jgi:dihydroneopterin triphosphate diphosphatase
MIKPFKIPQSVLVVIFTPELDVLLIKRADQQPGDADFWQSVTGSKDHLDESFQQTAVREVFEETGIDCGPHTDGVVTLTDWHLENVYDIYPRWRHRYPPGVTQNTEHLFGLQVPADVVVSLNPREHTAFKWLPWREAAEHCHSPSNAEAILMLTRFIL